MNGVAWLIAILFIVAGTLAYTGLWKGWIAVVRGYGTYIGFSLLYIGIALALAGLGLSFAGSNRSLFLALSTIAAVPLLVAIVGFWWLPRFLVPEWFRVIRESNLRQEGKR